MLTYILISEEELKMFCFKITLSGAGSISRVHVRIRT